MNDHIDLSSLQLLMTEGHLEDVIDQVILHLESCGACRDRLDEAPQAVLELVRGVLSERSISTEYSVEAYSAAMTAVLDKLSVESQQLECERDAAPGLLSELERAEYSQQQLLLRNSRKFQVWGFAEYLLGVSRSSWTEDPGRAEKLALLAFEVAENLQASGFRGKVANDLKAEAWSFAANCRRIKGELDGALEAFSRAEEFLELGTGDALERARMLDLKASLLRLMDQFGEARRLLEFVLAVYRASGERNLEAKALLSFAKLYVDMGEVEECLPILDRASGLLSDEGDKYLELIARMQLLYALTECDRAEEASSLLPELRSLARSHGNRLDRLHLLWLEGMVCQGQGQLELAEEVFKQAREGFAAMEMGYEVAHLSLDLAALYLEMGRTDAVKRLALEVVPQFAVQQIHADALAAIALFQQAAQKEQATLALVDDVASKVRAFQSGKSSN